MIRNVKNNNLGTNIGIRQIVILGFADDLTLIGDSMEIVQQNTNILVESAKSVGLKINQDKTKVMELLLNGEENAVINDLKIPLRKLMSSGTLKRQLLTTMIGVPKS